MQIEGRRASFALLDNDKGQGLLSRLPSEFLSYGHIMRLQDEGSSRQIFMAFNSTEELLAYMHKFPLKSRFFNEYIPGDRRTKPRFDLDIECDDPTQPYNSRKHLEQITPDNIKDIGKRTLTALLDAICRVFTLSTLRFKRALPFFPEEHIVVYESNYDLHGYPLSQKVSYHVIINGFCHDNYKEAHAFAKEVAKEMAYGRCFIDYGVYAKNCFLRCVNSRKIKGIGIFSGLKRRCSSYPWGANTMESKLMYPLFGYTEQMTSDGHVPLDDPNYALLELRESLITYVRDEITIPSFVSEIDRKIFDTTLTKEMIDSMMMLLRNWLPNADAIFRLREVKGNVIHLKRCMSSFCSMCNRNHDNRDPLLFLAFKTVRFYCCRNPDRKYETLGSIDYSDRERRIGIRIRRGR